MLVNPKKTDIKYPDCSVEDLALSFYDRINVVKDSAIAEINKLTGGDDLEISRIQMAMEWKIAKGVNDQDPDFSQHANSVDLNVLNGQEPTIIEIFLSASLHSSYFGEEYFEAGNLLEAFNSLASANETLGLAQGYMLATDMKDTEALIKKMTLSDKAGQARHAETRSIKKDCINYYASVWEDKINKLDKKYQAKEKDKAAIETTAQQPISLRKAREYIDEYLKEKK
jgi:hypothetical protein